MVAANVSIGLSAADLRGLQDDLRGVRNGARIAIYTAINDTLKSGRAELVRRMREHLTAKAGEVRDRIKVTKPARQDDLFGRMAVDYKAVPLAEFKGSASKRGVTAQPIKGQPAQTFKHAFRATMKSTHTGYFARARVLALPRATVSAAMRTGNFATEAEARMSLAIMRRDPKYLTTGLRLKRSRTQGPYVAATVHGFASRLPIDELFGPSVLTAFTIDPQIQEATFRDLDRKLAERVRSKVKWLLEKPSAAGSRRLRHI